MSATITRFTNEACALCGYSGPCAVHSGSDGIQHNTEAYCGECWVEHIGVLQCGMCGCDVGCGDAPVQLICVSCVNDLTDAKIKDESN